MKPRKPRKVRIMGADYKIVFKRLPDLFGKCNYTDRVIFINTDHSEAIQRESLLHELLHAILEECSEIDEAECKDREEKVIRYMSPRLFQIMCDNPRFSDYLFRSNT